MWIEKEKKNHLSKEGNISTTHYPYRCKDKKEGKLKKEKSNEK